MAKSLYALVRLAIQVLVAIFAIDSIVSHFRVSYTDSQNHDRLPPSEYRYSSDGSQANDYLRDEAHRSNSAHQRLHDNLKQKSGSNVGFTVTTWASGDRQTQHYTLERSYPDPTDIPSESLLSLVITKDHQSWGRNPTEEPRTIYNFLDFVTNTTLASQQASLAILTASPREFEIYKQILTPHEEDANTPVYYNYPFHRITLVLHPGNTRAPPITNRTSSDDDGEPQQDGNQSRNDRHNVAQHERRAIIAKLRNYLQTVALKHETHLLWLDSDVYKFSSNEMVEKMMRMTRTTDDAEVGVLTARCRLGEPEKTDEWLKTHRDFRLPPPPEGDEEEDERRGVEGGNYEVIAWKLRAQGHYDLNAWRGERVGPNNVEQKGLWKDLTSWEPHPGPDLQILDEAIDKTGDDDVVRLDSVGGTVLMFRADLVRMGLNFATGYFVGMTFEHGEGYDGIETEGVCLLTRSMSRDGKSMCYSMGGSWSVWHTVF
ncbi:hypothetical protein H2198_001132 [Neophaeococcomyces mojaviensis]|uniref:Uncharacterized protein n=1 Tax=Neophaeococcomyces mojaviensis TaxID=3383035 RepID=A0ACC3AHX7_9EURO|nr:hypothetical protein H2198_001132 [Knufia sp. JES_112]